MRLLPTLCLAALAGCAQLSGPANPASVSFLENTLTVHFYDGSVCRADIAAAPAGAFADCVQPLDYAVMVHRGPWIKGTETFLEPYAEIALARPADGRRWLWHTPQATGVGRDGTASGAVKLY